MTWYEINVPRIVWDRVDDEVVALDCVAGVYYRLNPAASDVWAAIDAGASTEQVASAGVDEVPLSSMIGELRKADVLRERSEPDPMPVAVTVRNEPLLLERFDDLQEMLAADPIHEVDPGKGWSLGR